MICIVSPHLDDAALSCADHAMAWATAGEAVLVVNVFTSSGRPAIVSPLMQRGLDAAGAVSPAQYAALRLDEDRACMNALGLEARQLGFVDAGFRGAHEPDYPDLKALLPGRLEPGDLGLVDAIVDALASLGPMRLMLGPLGIGGHVDHLITRAACERACPPAGLGRYADMPYARAPWNWRAAQLFEAMVARKSIKAMTDAKRAALTCYRSQMPLLFRGGKPRYPEIVLLPRQAPAQRFPAL